MNLMMEEMIECFGKNGRDWRAIKKASKTHYYSHLVPSVESPGNLCEQLFKRATPHDLIEEIIRPLLGRIRFCALILDFDEK